MRWRVGMWRSSHSNLTTFELWTFSADLKFVEFFHVPVVKIEPQVYTIGTTSHRNNQLNKFALPNSLKGPKIILDMADHHVSKDARPFRILGNALTYLLSDFFGITFLHFLSYTCQCMIKFTFVLERIYFMKFALDECKFFLVLSHT